VGYLVKSMRWFAWQERWRIRAEFSELNEMIVCMVAREIEDGEYVPNDELGRQLAE